MNKLMYGMLGVATLAYVALPYPAQAQLAEVNQAIVELTDAPGLGKRTTVDLTKRWGSDVGVIASATAKLQDALSKTTDPKAKAQLELAVEYGKAKEHKEARLSAQGALYYLCKAAGGTGDGCDKVPQYGSYVAP